MMTTTSVSFGGISFINGSAPEPDGSEWVLSDIDGWGGGGEVAANRTKRPQAHGDFAERAFRGPSVVVVDGWVHCPTRAAAAVAKRRLTSALADGTLDDVTVVDEDEGTLSARVRLAARPDIDWLVPTAIKVQFQLYAPDPLRYGPPVPVSTQFPVQTGGLEYDLYTDGAGADLGYLDYGEASTSGRVTLSNPGTADSWPQFEVTGPVDVSGFEIVAVGSGARLVFEGAVPASSRLVLDSATGVVVIDGVADRGGQLTWRDWAAVPAGGSVEYAFVPRGSTSGALLTASCRPAFW